MGVPPERIEAFVDFHRARWKFIGNPTYSAMQTMFDAAIRLHEAAYPPMQQRLEEAERENN